MTVSFFLLFSNDNLWNAENERKLVGFTNVSIKIAPTGFPSIELFFLLIQMLKTFPSYTNAKTVKLYFKIYPKSKFLFEVTTPIFDAIAELH